ncbi:MAG: NAD(P)/FAD-dependent oxidoreductase [Shinella sp.]|uniref:FAD-dependent oxidoreductase n=1 Tax=Shinella sp. TaxID=1870904 RepID=UPI003C741EBB
MLDRDVIVVGAGPVGLVAALVLAKAGLKIAVFEKRDQLNQVSKASTFHAPTLDILDRVGVYDDFSRQALHIDRLQYRTVEGGVLGELTFNLLEDATPYPFRKHLEQSLLTPLLLERLKTYPNVDFSFDAEYVGVEDHGDGVTVTLEQGGRRQSLSARLLLGADGAHSAVRQSVGIAFDGAAYPGFQLRIRTDDSIRDVVPDLGPVTYLVGKTHSVSFLHMPDNWRVILRVPEGISEETALTDEWAVERLDALLPGFRMPNVVDKDCYAARKCLASAPRSGNVYLAGDALHLTNTRGGMNMNCGIHDGFVIANAMVEALVKGDAGGLETAAAERHRVAREMLLPRTDTMVSQEKAWIEKVNGLLCDKEKAAAYLAQTAMLDMVALPARA